MNHEEIVHILGSRDRLRVMEALQEIPQMRPSAEALLLAVLDEEAPRQAAHMRRLTARIVSLAVLSLIGLSVSLFFGPGGWLLAIGLLALVSLFSAIGLATRLSEGSPATKRQQDAAAGLAALWETVEDHRSVGPLLELAYFWWPGTRLADAAFGALLRLLPRLQAPDAELLTAKQQQALLGIVHQAWRARRGKWWNAPDHRRADFYVTVFRAVSELRLTMAVPALRRLTTLPRQTENHRRVCEAAQECLYQLTAESQAGL